MKSKLAKPNTVTIYADGACQGNPGPGGYGVILVYGDRRKALSGGYKCTTNNRMELTAAITGLSALKRACNVRIITDSEYLVNAVNNGWAKRWRANGWRRGKKGAAQNKDLWEKLLNLCEQHEVRFEWVRGHSGHPENERCDELAVAAARSTTLIEDRGYTRVNT